MTDDADWAALALQNAFALWFTPELEHRAEQGILRRGSIVWGVQAILDLDLPAPIIRINSEISGVFRARSKGPVEKGQHLSFSELGDIEGVELTQEYPNAGHFTAILHNGAWFIAFDFRRNATRIAEHLTAITEFLDASAMAIERSLARPAVENLFAAVELMARSFLLMIPDRRVLNASSHGFVHTTFNLYGRTGLAPSEFVSLLNELRELRPGARYLRGLPPSVEACAGLLEQARAMFGHLDVNRPRRFSEPG